MRWQDVAAYWNDNADAWTELARAGADIWRDELNTPAFFAMLPPVSGLNGLDLGCGEGHNTRLAAERGAIMTAVDVATKFIAHAIEQEEHDPKGIKYLAAGATELPFADASFDFVMATMSLMDIAETELAIREASRVLKAGGFFQFSICHPCFQTRRFEWVERDGRVVGVICGDYFDRNDTIVERWTFSAAPEELQGKWDDFAIPRFDRTLSDWLNLLIDCSFRLEKFCEPRPSADLARRHPTFEKCLGVPLFLHVLCRKV